MRKILLTLIMLITVIPVFAKITQEQEEKLTALNGLADKVYNYKVDSEAEELFKFFKKVRDEKAKSSTEESSIENLKEELKTAYDKKNNNKNNNNDDNNNGSKQDFDLLYEKELAKASVKVPNARLMEKYKEELNLANDKDAIEKSRKKWAKRAKKFSYLYNNDKKFKNEIDRIEKEYTGIDSNGNADISKNAIAKEKILDIFNKAKIPVEIELSGEANKKNLKFLDAFYYKNNNIFDKLKGDVFLNVKFGSDLINTNGLLGSLLIGGTYSFKELNFNLGGFIQYDKQISDNYALGLTFQYDNLNSFLRYRLATYDKKLNHNIDAYVSYKYTYDIGDIKISPLSSIYTTISAPTKLDDYVLNTRFGFDINIGTEIKYQLTNELEIFTIPTITVSYNDQTVSDEDNDLPTKTRSYFDYHLNIGLNYEDDGIRLSPIIKLTGDMNGNVKFTTELGMGYIF